MITINITQDHIDRATKKRDGLDGRYDVCSHCVLAIAMSEALGTRCVVAYNVYYKEDINYYQAYPLPHKARMIMNKFDYKEPLKPCSFRIDK